MKDKDLDFESIKIIGQLGLIKNQEGSELPCFKDLENHEFNSAIVAALLYLIFERYTSYVSDEDQIEFSEEVLKFFNKMIENGVDYLHRVGDK